MSALHVLVYGNLGAGPCDVFRFGMHVDALAAHGVELRAFNGAEVGVPGQAGLSAAAALAQEDAVLDRDALDWADVIVFHRFYQTRWTCDACLADGDEAALGAHARATGHTPVAPDVLVRPLLAAFEDAPETLRGRAIVYETDDDLLGMSGWNGVSRRVLPEQDLVERLLRRADLVTTTTPVLADRLALRNDAVRVIRNAVDPSWYAPVPGGDRDARLALAYYGKPVRRRDYALCQSAVDSLAAADPRAVRRVWLGTDDALDAEGSRAVREMVDEALPYEASARAFAARLSGLAPAIGLAPLQDDPFNAAKSELHWLEYTLAGLPTVATRLSKPGPYDVIRDGVDGLLVRDGAGWHEALDRLVASAALREDLVGRARERVLADYTVEARAPEWAAAYRWAAEHAGRAVAHRVFGLGELSADAGEAQAAATLRHRQAARVAAAGAPAALAELRAERTSCAVGGPDGRTVSVLVPAVDEDAAVVARAVASAIDQTHRPLEIIVVGGPALPVAFTRLAQASGISLVRVPPPAAPRVGDRDALLAVSLAAAIDAASGAWLAPLSPECTWPGDRLETLVDAAAEHDLEVVYGQTEARIGGATPVLLGAWPPSAQEVLVLGTELIAAPLGRLIAVDPEAWRDGETAGWAWWRGMLEAGARAGMLETVTAVLEPLPEDAIAAAAGAATAGARP